MKLPRLSLSIWFVFSATAYAEGLPQLSEGQGIANTRAWVAIYTGEEAAVCGFNKELPASRLLEATRAAKLSVLKDVQQGRVSPDDAATGMLSVLNMPTLLWIRSKALDEIQRHPSACAIVANEWASLKKAHTPAEIAQADAFPSITKQHAGFAQESCIKAEMALPGVAAKPATVIAEGLIKDCYAQIRTAFFITAVDASGDADKAAGLADQFMQSQFLRTQLAANITAYRTR